MIITELNKYIESIKGGLELTFQIDDTLEINFNPLDYVTTAAIANNVSENVVSEYGDYSPELKNPLLLFHLLNKSADIELEDFDCENMFTLFNSSLGEMLVEHIDNHHWLRTLYHLTEEKIEFRKKMYCNPNAFINMKLSELVTKQLEIETKTESFMDTMDVINKSFNSEEIREYTRLASELNEAIKNPEVSDKFFKRVQDAAQERRIQEAEKVLEESQKIIKFHDTKNVLTNK